MSKFRLILFLLLACLLMTSLMITNAQQENLLVVETVTVRAGDSATLVLEISGHYRNGCERLGDISHTLIGNVIEVTITTTRPSGAVACTQALVPFTETVPLEISETLSAGEYTVIVNGVMATFTLNEDLTIEGASPSDQLACPTPIDGESLGYGDEASDYCFLYPAGIGLGTQEIEADGLVVAMFSGDFQMDFAPSLQVMSEPADSRSLLAIITDLQASDNTQEWTYSAMLIGNHLAYVVEDPTVDGGIRYAWIQVGDTLYNITLQPIDAEAYPVGTEFAESLWAMFTETLTFPTVTLNNVSVGEDLTLSLPENWDTIQRGDVLSLSIPADIDLFISLSPAQDDDPVATYTAQSDTVTVSTISIAGQDASLITGLDRTCAVIILPTQPETLIATIDYEGCLVDDETLHPVILDALAMIQLQNQ